ncbi:MAG TPA: hypothetical protein VFO29_07345 [Candidatus Rubrimentiphilum sp.]|nr:hypothetical protein [Candidatus Rubrimentiphilum sp.]
MFSAVVLAAALTPLQIFFHAEDTWEARKLPPFVAFDTAITHRTAGGAITQGSEHVILRTFDHWCSTIEVDQGAAEPKTSRGLNCLGPAYSPLGFNISSVYPASTQPDPFVPSQLPVIAHVRAIHYDVTFADEQTIDGALAYHLLLRPLGSPEHYPLRALWVDESDFQVRRLTYAENPSGWSASIDYSFKPYGPQGIWWISQIDASWQPGQHLNEPAFTSTLVLHNVSFPSV